MSRQSNVAYGLIIAICLLGNVCLRAEDSQSNQETQPVSKRHVTEIQMEEAIRERIILTHKTQPEIKEVLKETEESKGEPEPSVWEKLEKSVEDEKVF